MASQQYDPKTGKARVFFRYGGRQCNRTVKLKSARAAEALCETIEQTIADMERGRLALPPDADLVTFIISGGTLVQSAVPASAPKALTLSDVFERYRTEPPPHLETSTRKMQEIHFRRLLEVFPSKTVKAFDRATAQEYVVHPTEAYLASWIARILSLKDSWSRKPYACRFIVLILLLVPSGGPVLIG